MILAIILCMICTVYFNNLAALIAFSDDLYGIDSNSF